MSECLVPVSAASVGAVSDRCVCARLTDASLRADFQAHDASAQAVGRRKKR